MQGILIFLLILLVMGSVACVMFRSKVKAAISLALISVILSIIMFALGQFWAAIFELSVCAGLVTVVFVCAVSLTRPDRHNQEVEEAYHKKVSGLPVFMVILGIGLMIILTMGNFDFSVTVDAAAQVRTFNDVFWNTRQADIIGQIIIILAGAFAVVILFKEGDKA